MTMAVEPAPQRETQPIFRAAAVDRLSAPERLDIAAAIVRPGSWLVVAACLLFVAAAAVAGVLIEVPSKVHGNGILLVARGAHGTFDLKLANNTVTAPINVGGSARQGIRVDAGKLATRRPDDQMTR